MTGELPELYDADELSELPLEPSERSRAVALLLAGLGGYFGFHSFYAGRVHRGVWMALTLGGMGLWWLYDLVIVAAGEFRDAGGRRITRWAVEEGAVEGAASGRELRRLLAQVGRLERDVAELAERMDFAERLLAQQKDRERLR